MQGMVTIFFSASTASVTCVHTATLALGETVLGEAPGSVLAPRRCSLCVGLIVALAQWFR